MAENIITDQRSTRKLRKETLQYPSKGEITAQLTTRHPPIAAMGG